MLTGEGRQPPRSRPLSWLLEGDLPPETFLDSCWGIGRNRIEAAPVGPTGGVGGGGGGGGLERVGEPYLEGLPTRSAVFF